MEERSSFGQQRRLRIQEGFFAEKAYRKEEKFQDQLKKLKNFWAVNDLRQN